MQVIWLQPHINRDVLGEMLKGVYLTWLPGGGRSPICSTVLLCVQSWKWYKQEATVWEPEGTNTRNQSLVDETRA